MTKVPVQKQSHITAQQQADHQDATDIQNQTIFLCFSKAIFYTRLDKTSLHASIHYI